MVYLGPSLPADTEPLPEAVPLPPPGPGASPLPAADHPRPAQAAAPPALVVGSGGGVRGPAAGGLRPGWGEQAAIRSRARAALGPRGSADPPAGSPPPERRRRREEEAVPGGGMRSGAGRRAGAAERGRARRAAGRPRSP